MALAEGGLPSRYLPWDLGIGEPGLEVRLDLTQDRWFAAMRAALPGSVPMPYGWTEALRRAGLQDVTTRSILTEKPVPLSDADLDHVVSTLRYRVDQLTPGTARGHGQGHGHGHGHGHELPEELALPAADLAIWRQLLDPDSEHYLGRRTDLSALSVRSIHVGQTDRHAAS